MIALASRAATGLTNNFGGEWVSVSGRYLIYSLAFISGFTVMAVELLGGRLLAPYFGNSIYVWGSIISVFMLSLSVGYLVGGRFSLNLPSITRFSWLFFFAALALLPCAIFNENIMLWVFERVDDPRYGSLLAAGLLFFLPTAILGMVSPYSVRLLIEATASSGQTAGHLYFVSTAGSALGTLMMSFYLVLWMEQDHILFSLDAVLIGCGVIALLFRHHKFAQD